MLVSRPEQAGSSRSALRLVELLLPCRAQRPRGGAPLIPPWSRTAAAQWRAPCQCARWSGPLPAHFSSTSAPLRMGWHLSPTLIPSYPIVFLPLLLSSWAFTRAERSPCGQHTILNRRSHLSLLTTWLGGSLLCAPVCEHALSLAGAMAATTLPSWGRVPSHHSEPAAGEG